MSQAHTILERYKEANQKTDITVSIQRSMEKKIATAAKRYEISPADFISAAIEHMLQDIEKTRTRKAATPKSNSRQRKNSTTSDQEPAEEQPPVKPAETKPPAAAKPKPAAPKSADLDDDDFGAPEGTFGTPDDDEF